jgi:hypothetical protein
MSSQNRLQNHIGPILTFTILRPELSSEAAVIPASLSPAVKAVLPAFFQGLAALRNREMLRR